MFLESLQIPLWGPSSRLKMEHTEETSPCRLAGFTQVFFLPLDWIPSFEVKWGFSKRNINFFLEAIIVFRRAQLLFTSSATSTLLLWNDFALVKFAFDHNALHPFKVKVNEAYSCFNDYLPVWKYRTLSFLNSGFRLRVKTPFCWKLIFLPKWVKSSDIRHRWYNLTHALDVKVVLP